MADDTPAVPAEAPQAPESIADTSINTNPAPAPTPVPDMHGFTSEELAKMRTFFDNSGGFEAVKSKISNPQPVAEPTQQAQPQPQPQMQPQPQVQAQPTQPPKGYASLQELSVERYFKDLAADPKYANISEQIASGEILKEMDAMGMKPIDDNFNINVGQLNSYLALKSASVPTKPTSSEPNNTPTVDYVQVGDNITDMNQALAVYQQSMAAKSKGLPEHPALMQAKEYLAKNWGKK